MTDFSSEKSFAARVGTQASEVLRRNASSVGEAVRKTGTDIVTSTDYEAERLLLAEIERFFPEDAVLAEESGVRSAPSGRRWCIDPLDGTVNFANGIPYYCVSIGLEDEQGGAVGVVVDPVRDEVFAATRASVAELPRADPTPASSVGDAVIALQLPEPLWRQSASLLEWVHATRGWRVTGSVALDLAWTAVGRYDLCLYRRTPQRWDWLAGEILIAATPGKQVVSLGMMGELELVAAGTSALIAELRRLVVLPS